MRTLTAVELKTKLERRPDLPLIMVLSREAFAKAHIPGSINLQEVEEAVRRFRPNQELVVYCSDHACVASVIAYQVLTAAGFTNVYRFAGGLSEWAANGFPLEEDQGGAR